MSITAFGKMPFHGVAGLRRMANLAIHDALNAIERKYQPYAYDKKAEAGTSANAAVASAAYHVMAPTTAKIPAEVLPNPKCLENAKAVIEGSYAAALAVIPDETEQEKAAKEKGIALGKAAAEAVLAKRANDNADTGGPYINKTCPPATTPAGKYQCTPGFPFVAFEKWEIVTPFVLKDHTEFRPGPPYKVDDAKFKADLAEVKTLGSDGKAMPTTRTPEQIRDRAVLVRKLATQVGSHRPDDRDRQRARPVGQRPFDGHHADGADGRLSSPWSPARTSTISGGRSRRSMPTVTSLGCRSMPTPPDQDLSVRSLHRRWGGCGGAQAVLWHRSDELQGLWRNDGARPHLLG